MFEMPCRQVARLEWKCLHSRYDSSMFQLPLTEACNLQRKLEEAQAFMESVNRSKLGVDWRNIAAANEPGQLSQRPVGEGMMIGKSRCTKLPP